MSSQDVPRISLESGQPLLLQVEAEAEVRRLNDIYQSVAAQNGFGFKPDTAFREEFTEITGGSYFHQFTEKRLPAPLEMFYLHDEKRFSLGMGFELVPESWRDNMQKNALVRLATLSKTFKNFHHFLEGEGYRVNELTGSVNSLDYDYHGIKAQSLDDVAGLTTFLGKVKTYLSR